MDRQAFLDALKEHLKVLEDEEQEDILDEYLQHIEMKIKDGQEEEEAIKDFGPVQELAAEILEAYHVKPDLGQGQERGKTRGKTRGQKRWRKLVSRTGSFAGRTGSPGPEAEGVEGGAAAGELGRYIKRAAFSILGAGKKAGRLILQCGRGIFRVIKSPFRWMGAYMASGRARLSDGGAAGGCGYAGQGPAGFLPNAHVSRGAGVWAGRAQERRTGGLAERAGRGIFRSVRRLVRWLVDLTLWCCRMVWNAGVLFVMAFSAFVGLCFLFCLGVLTVLLCQGYPFAGPAIGCLGAVLCCAALTVFSCTFFAGTEKGEVRGAGRGRKPEGIARENVQREIKKEHNGVARSRGLARQETHKAIEKEEEEIREKEETGWPEKKDPGDKRSRDGAMIKEQTDRSSGEDGAKRKEALADHGQEG